MERRQIRSRCRLGLSVLSVEDGCVRWVEIVELDGAFLGINVGHPIVTNGTSCAKLRASMWYVVWM